MAQKDQAPPPSSLSLSSYVLVDFVFFWSFLRALLMSWNRISKYTCEMQQDCFSDISSNLSGCMASCLNVSEHFASQQPVQLGLLRGLFQLIPICLVILHLGQKAEGRGSMYWYLPLLELCSAVPQLHEYCNEAHSLHYSPAPCWLEDADVRELHQRLAAAFLLCIIVLHNVTKDRCAPLPPSAGLTLMWHMQFHIYTQRLQCNSDE